MSGFIDVHGHVVLEESMGAAGAHADPSLAIIQMEPHSLGSVTGDWTEFPIGNLFSCKRN